MSEAAAVRAAVARKGGAAAAAAATGWALTRGSEDGKRRVVDQPVWQAGEQRGWQHERAAQPEEESGHREEEPEEERLDEG